MNSQPNLSQVLVRTKGNGEVTYYVYGLGLIGEQSAGNYFSYLFDYRGSTVAITDTTGQIIDTVQYSPFGVVLSQPTFDTPFLFNGLYGVMTDDNSLSYMRARYYSADIRRFVNQDVLLGNVADGQSLNRFAFVTGNPVSFVDPFGLAEMLGGEYLEEFDTAFSYILLFFETPICFDFNQFSNEVEENRFNLALTGFSLVAVEVLGTMPKIPEELRGFGIPKNDLNKITNQLSRWSSRIGYLFKNKRLLRNLGRKPVTIVISNTATLLIVFEGFYDWGVIGKAAWDATSFNNCECVNTN